MQIFPTLGHECEEKKNGLFFVYINVTKDPSTVFCSLFVHKETFALINR